MPASRGSRHGPRKRPWFVLSPALVAAAFAGSIASTGIGRNGHALPPQVASTLLDHHVATVFANSRERVVSTPSSAEAWGDYGLLLAAHDQQREAFECFTRASDLAPGDWRWPHFAGVVMTHWDLQGAAAWLARAVAIAPDEEWPRLVRGTVLLGSGLTRAADEEYSAVLAFHPRHAVASLGRARVAVAENRGVGALEAVQPALSDPATRRAAHELAAGIHHAMGSRAEAEHHLAVASALPADVPWPREPFESRLPALRASKHSRIELIKSLQARGMVSETEKLSQELFESHPEVHCFVEGRRMMDRGDYRAAEERLLAGLRIAPDAVEIRDSLARTKIALGRRDEAVQILRGMVADEPGNGPAWLLLGTVLCETSPTEGIEALRKATGLMPLADGCRAAVERAERAMAAPRPGEQ